MSGRLFAEFGDYAILPAVLTDVQMKSCSFKPILHVPHPDVEPRDQTEYRLDARTVYVFDNQLVTPAAICGRSVSAVEQQLKKL